MTPSINRLSASAVNLGTYILEHEWDLLVDEFTGAGEMDFDQFTRWVTGYMYYDALVCKCSGQIGEIMVQLEQDFEELSKVSVEQGQ